VENILRHTKVTEVHKGSTAAAGDPFTSKVDMAGWNGVRFIGCDTSTGNTTGGNTLAAYEATSSTVTSTSDGYTAISGGTLSSTAGAGPGILQIDVALPKQRYVAAKITRTTAVVFGPVLAEQYGSPRMQSSTKGSTDDLATAVLVQPQSTGSTST
jgi:hypothetical protein